MTISERRSASVTITPADMPLLCELKEIWDYRELLYFLIWRDIKVRYKQTLLGISWVVLQPLATTLVFSIFFGRLARVPSDGIPYPIFVFAALVPWTLFASGLTQAATSLVGSRNLISKVYFPRILLPLASVILHLMNCLINLCVLLLMAVWYGLSFRWQMLCIGPLILIALMAALGAGLFISALNVRYRDVQHILPFLVQFWLFATPIAYPASLLSGGWQTAYSLNPMVGVVEGFRWALLSSRTASTAILVSCGAAFVLLVSGVMYFKRQERTFEDII